jgi:hypothetical protein
MKIAWFRSRFHRNEIPFRYIRLGERRKVVVVVGVEQRGGVGTAGELFKTFEIKTFHCGLLSELEL